MIYVITRKYNELITFEPEPDEVTEVVGYTNSQDDAVKYCKKKNQKCKSDEYFDWCSADLLKP